MVRHKVAWYTVNHMRHLEGSCNDAPVTCACPQWHKGSMAGCPACTIHGTKQELCGDLHGRERKAVVVAIRGTMSIADVVTDAVVHPEDINDWLPPKFSRVRNAVTSLCACTREILFFPHRRVQALRTINSAT